MPSLRNTFRVTRVQCGGWCGQKTWWYRGGSMRCLSLQRESMGCPKKGKIIGNNVTMKIGKLEMIPQLVVVIYDDDTYKA